LLGVGCVLCGLVVCKGRCGGGGGGGFVAREKEESAWPRESEISYN